MIGKFNQMITDVSGGVTDFTKNGNCSCCGECCTNNLPLSQREIQEIKRYIKANEIKEQRNLLLNASIDMTCPFMDKSNTDKKCKIYEIRPAVCKHFICSDTNAILKAPEMYADERKTYNVRAVFYGS